jgi:S-DNA-T family DNA segregation ATPase FtsK/SpoIIIE
MFYFSKLSIARYRQIIFAMSNKKQSFQEQKLQYQLAIQSHQIERVFNQHRLDARVAGGMVQPNLVSFDLQSQLSAGLERLRNLQGDLMTALGVTDVSLVREDGKLQLRIGRPHEPAVPLLPLLDACPELPPATIPIGLAEGGHPVLLQFDSNAVTNVLIAGGPLAGKTTLLRTMAAALALCNRQSELQVVILDPCKAIETGSGSEGEVLRANAQRNSLLKPLNYLPHLVTDVVSGLAESASVLQFLAEELAYRREQNVVLPRIIILIDHAVTLLERGGSAVSDIILQLLQHGPDTGIHMVLATRRPGAAELDAALKANLTLRLVGQVETTAEAYQASGVRGSQADGLLGLGDFVAVVGNDRTHFQAAYIGDYDLHMSLTGLYGTQRPRLLARPFETRVRLPQEKTPVNTSFSVKNGQVALDEDTSSPPAAIKPTPPPPQAAPSAPKAVPPKPVDSALAADDDDDLIFGLD